MVKDWQTKHHIVILQNFQLKPPPPPKQKIKQLSQYSLSLSIYKTYIYKKKTW